MLKTLSRLRTKITRRVDIYNVNNSLHENDVAVTCDPVVSRWFRAKGYWSEPMDRELLGESCFLVGRNNLFKGTSTDEHQPPAIGGESPPELHEPARS